MNFTRGVVCKCTQWVHEWRNPHLNCVYVLHSLPYFFLFLISDIIKVMKSTPAVVMYSHAITGNCYHSFLNQLKLADGDVPPVLFSVKFFWMHFFPQIPGIKL